MLYLTASRRIETGLAYLKVLGFPRRL